MSSTASGMVSARTRQHLKVASGPELLRDGGALALASLKEPVPSRNLPSSLRLAECHLDLIARVRVSTAEPAGAFPSGWGIREALHLFDRSSIQLHE